MSLKLLSFSYPQPQPDAGYWGPVTSTLNWCEEDYYATIYSAEIVNTLTNLLFIGLGTKGLWNCVKYEHDSVFKVAFVGYLLVGSGSFAFHSTLKYPMQLVDELSMIYTACLMCYATFSFSQSRVVRVVLGAGLTSLAIFITLYYHYLQDPLFHQNAFAILTTIILLRSMYVMEINIRPSLRAKYSKLPKKEIESRTERFANDQRDEKIIKQMWILVGMGLSIFLCGFGIWNLDNLYCSKIRVWRNAVGLPWGILLEGHGWWHLMTGIGSYFYLVWGIFLRHCLNGRQDEFMLNWPHWTSIPEVIPIPIAPVNENGSTVSYDSDGNGNVKSESRKSV